MNNVTSVATTRKRRGREVSISKHLQTFRQSKTSGPIRDALADIAIRLIDMEDRDEFERMDGPTALGSIAISKKMRNLFTFDLRLVSSRSFSQNHRRTSNLGIRMANIHNIRFYVSKCRCTNFQLPWVLKIAY